LDTRTILELFEALNDELSKSGVIGEVGLCGGAVMCLVFNARDSTRDVDAIFKPTQAIREAAARVGRRYGVPQDWLNDAAKGYFLNTVPAVEVLNRSNLRVWAPGADYMLAMKCLSARFDTHDADDVRFLVRHLGLHTSEEVLNLIEAFYPRKQVPAKTQFFIEELLA